MDSILIDIVTCFIVKPLNNFWMKLKVLLTHTRFRIVYLKYEFHNTRKGDMKVRQYLDKMKNLVNKLKLITSPISNSNLAIYTLNSLDSDYNPMVIKLSNHINISWIELKT